MKKIIVIISTALFIASCGNPSSESNKNEEVEQMDSTGQGGDPVPPTATDQDSAISNMKFSYRQALSNGPGQIFKSDAGDISLFVFPGGFGCVQNTPSVIYNPDGLGELSFPKCLQLSMDSVSYNAWMFSLVVNTSLETDNLLMCNREDSSVVLNVQNVQVENPEEVDTMTFIVFSPQNEAVNQLIIDYSDSFSGEKKKSVKVFAESTGEGWEKPPKDEK